MWFRASSCSQPCVHRSQAGTRNPHCKSVQRDAASPSTEKPRRGTRCEKMVSLLLLLGNCNAATAWAHRGEWLEAAFGRHRRWGPPPLLEGSLRQSSQSCTIQLPARVEDKNLGSKMLPQESPANRRERCGDHMLAKPYFRHSRSCLSSRRGYIKGWSSTICTQFGDGPSPITH